MESLVSFSKWLSKWFTVAVILWAAFNYALPATSSWVIPNTAYLLGLILFGMGLTLTTEDFKRIAKRPIPVVLGTVDPLYHHAWFGLVALYDFPS